MSAPISALVIHEHWLVKDHRSPSQPARHSHAKGESGHLHPAFGPSFYGYGGALKTSKRVNGPQFPYVDRPAEDAFFDVILCDGALVPTESGKGLRPLVTTDLTADGYLDRFSGYSVVERMEHGFDLTARFHDWRTVK